MIIIFYRLDRQMYSNMNSLENCTLNVIDCKISGKIEILS